MKTTTYRLGQNAAAMFAETQDYFREVEETMTRMKKEAAEWDPASEWEGKEEEEEESAEGSSDDFMNSVNRINRENDAALLRTANQNFMDVANRNNISFHFGQ